MYVHVAVDNEATKNLYMKSGFVYEKWNLFIFFNYYFPITNVSIFTR
jgi:hypothetical protein